MKKLLIALVLGLLLVAALATVASADNGPHGGFTATTDACANCHRAHSAQTGDNALLIVPGGVEALCLSCHDGTGAGTNVVDGVYAAGAEGTVNASLFGGGFDFAKMATTWSGAATANPAFDATSKATTSHHKLGTVETVWGSGAINTVNDGMTLECTSCHDPHGNAGWTNATTKTQVCNPTLATASPLTEACTVRVASYRLLRFQPSGSNGFAAPTASVNWSGGVFPTGSSGTSALTGWTVPDNFATNGTEWYTIGTTSAFAVGDYNAGDANNVYNVTGHSNLAAGINVAYFCAQCHDRYFNGSALRNNTDASAYCYGGVARGTGALPAAGALADPVNSFSVSTVDPIACKAYFGTLVRNGPNYWHWGDNRGTGDTVYMFRHTSGDIRASMDGQVAAGAGTSLSRSCVACHVAHGTTASMTNLASVNTLVPLVAPATTNNSVLLRMDNRSICLRCHTPNFTVAP